MVQVQRRGAPVREASCQQLVRQHADAPDVTLLIIVLQDELRSHVCRRACRVGGLGYTSDAAKGSTAAVTGQAMLLEYREHAHPSLTSNAPTRA